MRHEHTYIVIAEPQTKKGQLPKYALVVPTGLVDIRCVALSGGEGNVPAQRHSGYTVNEMTWSLEVASLMRCSCELAIEP